jgi:myo-inositol 2-dehydrogenase/D-chiro-inositol 1-dehydrogenase
VRGADRARACLRAVRAAGVPLFLGFQRRFDPSFAALKRRLDAGEIGRPEIILLTSRDPEAPPIEHIRKSDGLFRETMIHDLDVARWLLGEEPIEVYAAASCLTDPRIAEAGSVDTAIVTLRTRSGALCAINNSWRSVYGYDQRAEVHGSQGLLQIGNRQPTSVAKWDGSGGSTDRPLYFFIDRYADAYRLELDAFVTALAERRPVTPDAVDGLRSLVLADCAQESYATGRPVAVPMDGGP